ncbi:MAG: DUF4982 domain-containing protein [Oscillospiraceae bacterium]|nr:DUF4982 domain-containing protein [Oscillospiraceae bacterium]
MKRTLFCDKWEFALTPIGTEYEDAHGWERVDLPHDWLIYDTKDLYKTSTGWYRRTYVHKNDGLRTALRFEGVYMDSRIYVNGVQAFEWKNGYTTFDADITEYLHEGENVIAVRVDHRAPNSRWYSGAGIYRNVWLCRYPDTHILPDGIYVSTKECDDAKCWNVTVSVEIERPETDTVDGYSLVILFGYGDSSGELYKQAELPLTAADKGELPALVVRDGYKYSINTFMFAKQDPRVWNAGEAGAVYICRAELKKNGDVIDTDEVKFGFREFKFTPRGGFFINGEHLKIHGVCEHHDLGALGAAMNKNALRRKLTKLRTMGVNAIRTSHNPPAVELMELCDEMGFLVLSEFTDVWEIPKTEFDYVRFAKDWREKDVASWVRRDRNHPCLIGWSIGNEIPDTGADEHGQELTTLMKRLVRQNDPRCNGIVTIGSNQMRTANGKKCADILKYAGYNYAEELYDADHETHPDWCIYGSETSSVVTSRGIYHFPLEQSNLGDDDGQCSALGNGSPIWAAKNWEWCITKDRDAEYCAGQFIWTGFDYIGEPTPYDSKNSYFGQFDTAGFEKDGAYVFRGAWTDPGDSLSAPFVHIFPHWDFSEGETIDIRVASNLAKVELYFNEKLIKSQEFDRRNGKELLMDVKLPYEKGWLLARGYNESGTECARDYRHSFSDTHHIIGIPDKEELKADGRDLIFVEISAYDEDNEFVANASDRVNVEVTGAGRLIGLDNGDSQDFEQYKCTSRRLFSGKLLAIIAAKDKPGDINVSIASPSAKGMELTLKAVPAEVPEGMSCIEENKPCEADVPDAANDIPVRKIELISESRTFTPERRTIRFEAKLHPGNASYSDITYRLTSVNAIDTKLARIISSDSSGATVECISDGDFYLRALCRNGGDRVRLMSVIKLTGEGLGSAFHDAYELTEAGLYSLSDGDIKNGIEHGVRIGNGGGWFGIENIDFGDVGTDTVTIPVFTESNDTIRIRMYDGTPDKGELVGDFGYSRPSKWLEYQEETYRLTKTLHGVHTISVSVGEKTDIKGFIFEKRLKECSEIFAVNSESIYGDKYTVEQDAVTGIGNNVILGFGEFDFSVHSPEKLIITGQTRLEMNSIQVILEGEHGGRFVCEFGGSDEYISREYPLAGISGKVKVSFVFLPGCDFDFRSFMFV